MAEVNIGIPEIENGKCKNINLPDGLRQQQPFFQPLTGNMPVNPKKHIRFTRQLLKT
jgi:hypothetical protein